MFDTFNPEMLALARDSRAVSQTDIAQVVGCTAGLVSKWENGVSLPSPERIEQIAEYLRYPSSLLFQPERIRGTDSICFHHRKRKTMPARLLDQVEAEMHLAQIQTKRLLRGLRVVSERDFVTLDPDDHGGPREVARILRAAWRIPTGPIPNVVTLVEAAGAVVIFRDFNTQKLDGMSAWSKDTPPVFFLNRSNPIDRTRWTIAHELGHLVMHKTMTEDDPETEADLFAQELLIPTNEVFPDLRNLSFSRLPALKSYWRVSMKALINTAGKLDALPKNKVQSLFVQHSRAGWNQREPYPLTPEEPSVIKDAIEVHLREHRYTIEELARVVHLTTDEFTQRYDVDRGINQQRLRIV